MAERKTVVVTDHLAAELKKAARHRGTTMSRLLEEILTRAMPIDDDPIRCVDCGARSNRTRLPEGAVWVCRNCRNLKVA